MPIFDLHYSALALALLLASAMDVLDWIIEQPVSVFEAYSDLVRWAADSVRSLFHSYGYWVIFLGTLSENTLLVGLIIPGALVVILAGLTAHEGTISLPLAILAGIAGTVIGDSISYCLGRFGWSRFGRSATMQEAMERVREPILRRGILFVLVYHFAGYTRLIGPTAAGLLKLPFGRWAPFDYLGASLWVVSFVALGYVLGLLGLTLDSTGGWFRVVEWGLLLFVMGWGLYLIKLAMPILQPQDESEREPEATAAGR